MLSRKKRNIGSLFYRKIYNPNFPYFKKESMDKPYLKKYCKISKFTVWIVNGKYIRNNLDEEFTNFGQHYRFSFIPINEFWIDKEYDGGGEEKFYIDHLLVEHRLMSKGISYIDALIIADKTELRERSKSSILLNEMKKKFKNKEIFKLIHKSLWKKYSINGLRVWIIRGELVRDRLFIDFTEGGHDKVYPFIPDGEIWIEDDLNPNERKFVLLHELHERNLMMKMKTGIDIKNGFSKLNKKYLHIYASAHNSASNLEYYCRHHLNYLDKKINIELNKIKNGRCPKRDKF